MDYRKFQRGTEEFSVIGLGTSSIGLADEKEIEETVVLAIENGINYFDMASADAKPFEAYGRAMAGKRDKAYLQIHFGASYETGKYGWTVDLDTIKKSIDWQLKALKTDYIDIGFIHCIDEQPDLDRALGNGILEYIEKLKNEGSVHYIGISSHSPQMVNKMLDTKLIDMVMFSINPAYDYRHGDYAIGSIDERMALYRRCEKDGVGISVMKAFGGGQLLNARTSPFHQELTEYQCIQYALDKPGVLTVLPGIRDKHDLERILGFLHATAEDKDYSVLGTFTHLDSGGVCVYCNHCQPCPSGLDVGLINKYYDLALAGDELAGEHYKKLARKADACAHCGHCNSRCPFHVDQVWRMKQISEYFQIGGSV